MSDSHRTFQNLNANNYAAWAPEMEAYLKVKGVWEYADPSATTKSWNKTPVAADPKRPTAAEMQEIRTWHRENNQAAGLLFMSIDESQRFHVKDIKDDPRGIWDALRNVNNQQKKPANRFSAFDALFSIQKDPDEDLITLFGRVSKAAQAIKALRPETYKLEDFDAELESMVLIRSLPSDYDHVVSSLLLLDPLEVTKLPFHSEETKCKAQERKGAAAAASVSAIK